MLIGLGMGLDLFGLYTMASAWRRLYLDILELPRPHQVRQCSFYHSNPNPKLRPGGTRQSTHLLLSVRFQELLDLL